MFLKMRDEKEERKKQARSNKQTRQSNTAHPCTLELNYSYTVLMLLIIIIAILGSIGYSLSFCYVASFNDIL